MKNKVILWVLICTLGISAYGSNGSKMIGQTTRSSGMGGSGIAINEDVSSSDSNPASLSYIEGSVLQFDLGLISPKTSFEGPNQKINGESMIIPLPSFSYAHRVENSDLVLGISLIGEGGLGTEYNSGVLNQKFSSDLAYATLNFTAAYKINDKWSVGVTPYLSYSAMNMEIGNQIKLEEMKASGYGIKIGTIYSINERWNVALKYTVEDQLDYEGKYYAIGSNEGSAETNLSWPSELALGTSYKLTEKLLLAADIKFIDWSNAMKSMDIKLEGAKDQSIPLDWKDQIVYAIGLEYSATEKIKLRAGYNYGANPIPSATVMPILSLITEHHITAGIGYEYSENLTVNGSLEYAFNNNQKNTKSLIGGTSETGITIGSLGISYKL
ncbi:OmpP1/FadL family transporter [Psychrilyobacter atlanticus]|uniref:OmpP1/FadL family transporter n=1 Tax=Psychrilyobacter atlanticus TaxID=271091 RepID=UPI0003FB657A|nr:outer membrane protein transport protein [Psychrilyobacter atlanticus]